MLDELLLGAIKGVLVRTTGLIFRPRDDAKLTTAILKRMEVLGLAHLAQYHQLLVSGGEEGGAELIKLSARLVNLESYFFRDQAQFALLQHKLLPQLIKTKRPGERIKIWSAGCSEGEEVYSVAIALSPMLGRSADWPAVVIGTDLSPDAIAIAKEGRYQDYAFRRCPKGVKERFFLPEGAIWSVKPEIKNRVQFYQHNLIGDPFPPQVMGTDIILCRNVMIYLEKEAVRKLVEKFYDLLPVGGILLTGPGELYLSSSHRFRHLIVEGAVFHQKSGGGGAYGTAGVSGC